jgi:signal transduction histidine kinase/tetratricopeptide (TPR) repeat protein
VKIRLNWQKRAIIIFSATIFLLSVILTIFAIREVEREKLVREREIEEEQQRVAELIISQVKSILSQAEGRIDRLFRSSQMQFPENEMTEVCRRLAEDDEIIAEIFIVNEKGQMIFPLFKPLFLFSEQGQYIKENSIKIEDNILFKRAESVEFKTKNYPLAIKSYQELMDKTSDSIQRAVLMNCIGHCYLKSGNHLESIKAYQKNLKESPNEACSDGIPLGLIALYQIGSIYWNINRKIEATETFFELTNGLLKSQWPLSKKQFLFYLNKVKDRLKTSIAEIKEIGDGEGLMKKWEELESFEEEQLSRMDRVENLTQKVIPLIETRRSAKSAVSGNFYHLSETIVNEIYLVSYTPLDENSVFGIKIDSEILAKKLLPPILEKLPLGKNWYVQIKDGFGNTVAGEDITYLKDPIPQLTFSRGFEEDFPPWNVNIFKSSRGSAARQFNLRRNIYLLSVAVVVLALLFGGFLAIRSTAKELELAKLKSDFVSTISHEFRTPLTSIRYLAEMLQRGRVKGEGKKQKYYETITAESERLSRLIENILDFSKIEAGMKEYNFEEVDLAEWAGDIANRFQEQVAPQEFVINREISEPMTKATVDREALSRALFNLLDNAAKYSGASRNIYFRAWAERENVFLEVRDEGIGISKEDQKKVFEKFYRSHNVSDSNIKGSGLGLTVVDHIVKAHGGEIHIESEVGKGTKVTIKIPAKQEAP